MRFEVGQPVRVVFTKWNGRPHWAYDGVYLGVDQHGEWIGHPAGTLMARPGRSFTDTLAWVTLVPSDGGWLSSYNPLEHHLEIYIDLTTPARWDAETLQTVDLDLDVVVPRDGREPFIDDEDEFAQHQVLYGYPDELVVRTEQTAKELLTAVIDRDPPFDGTADHWLSELARVAGS